MECARCGSPVGPAAVTAGEPPRCEACKWAVLSHQPVGGPSAVPLGRAATAGIPVATYQGPQALLSEVAYANRPSSRALPIALHAAAAGTVLGAGIYGFQVWTGRAPVWLFALLGLAIANAAAHGNDRRPSVDTRWIGATVAAITGTIVVYFCYRHAAIAALEREGIHAPLALLVQWRQLTYLFGHAGGWPWWLLVAVTTLTGALPTVHRFRPARAR